MASFIGLVRGGSGADEVCAMTLEHYPGMSEQMLAAIAARAQQRWDLQRVRIIHRHGRLLPGERIVLVVTCAPHREAALEGCAFLIDWLKTRAPFWKCEEYGSGRLQWVEARDEDDQAASRWLKDPTP